MMESIEKLRDELRICEMTGSRPTIAFVAQCADEIEREIAEKYMVRPCDMDGVPVKIGDELSHDGFARSFIVHSYELTNGAWSVWDVANGATHLCQACRHVKPRTLEDIVTEAIEYGHGIYPPTHCYDAKVDELCAEIRELMEVDA